MAGIKSNLKSMAKSLTGNIEKVTLVLGGYSSSALDSLTDTDASSAIQVELPFNPSSINLRSIAGGGHAIATSASTKCESVDPRLELSFKAYVDEVNSYDAFLFEKVNSGSDGIGLVRSALNLATNTQYSVAAYVEGLLAALRTETHSQIWFLWGNMEYGGALNSVNARYTMFNPSGNPIKAEIDIRISCVSKGKKNLKKEWQDKYEEAISKLTSSDSLGIDLANSSALNRFISL